MRDSETTGSLAAMAAPFFMALGFIIWDKIWSKSGGSAFALNLFKCNLASIGFVIAGLIFGFRVGSDDDNNDHGGGGDTLKSVGFLILSGFIGIILGDLAWLEALNQLGAIRVIVIDTIKPFSATFLGWLILDESIHKVAFSGIALTVLGVLLVSLEGERRNVNVPIPLENDGDEEKDVERTSEHMLIDDMNKEDTQIETNNELHGNDVNIRSDGGIPVDEKQTLPPVQIKLKTKDNNNLQHQQPDIHATTQGNTRKGYILAILNILLDTYGSVLTKQHGQIFSSWTINLIRFGSSGLAMFALSCAMHLHKRIIRKRQPSNSSTVVSWYQFPQMDRQSWMKISLGVLFVTFLCPALSNYALFQISLGLALSLGSITPLYALFLEWPIYGKEKRPTARSIGGASLAIAGVVILSIYNSEEK